MTDLSPRAAAAAGLVAAVYSLYFTADSFTLWFTGDDLMNMYGAWSAPLWKLAVAQVHFWSPFYRPLGALLYRVLFAVFGLNPAPFHAVQFLVNGLSIWFAWCLARRLSGSRLAAALAIVPLCYHTCFLEIWTQFSTIYDSLTFLFCSAAMLLYVRIRQEDRLPDRRETVALLALYLCGLNSKELAVTLPALVFLYELLLGGRRIAWPLAIAAAVMTLAFTAGKLTPGEANPLSNNQSYAMSWSWKHWIVNLGHYADNWFFKINYFDHQPRAWRLLGASLLMAALSRRLLFYWLAILVGTLPVVLLPPRGGFAVWWPSFFVFLFVASIAAAAVEWLRFRIEFRFAAVNGAVVAVALALAWFTSINRVWKPYFLRGIREGSAPLEASYERLAKRFPLKRGSAVYFENDLTGDSWELFFLLALHGKDETLIVRRAKQGFKTSDGPYDYSFTLDDKGNYVELRP